MIGRFHTFTLQGIVWSFYLLFFLVPIILTPYNYELFEYNKMMLVYSGTVIIVGLWILRCLIEKKFIFRHSPFDIPIALFFASQLISTILSIDLHVSLWGYYSRFNGGLVSIISYILIYYAFVSNFPRSRIPSLIGWILASALLVSLYGVAEHFGIDKHIWVQDVQNRVFSTLGQPNWLAAYLAVLVPITVGLGLSGFHPSTNDSGQEVKSQKLKVKSHTEKIGRNFFSAKFKTGLLVYWIIGLLFYVTLIFTKSRSGFVGFWGANAVFWILLFFTYKKSILKPFLLFNAGFVFLMFLFGSPFAPINRFTLPSFIKQGQQQTANSKQQNIGGSVIDIGITESAAIRKIVWKGALDIVRHYPYFGSGVETFAFSYYQFRPIEHNLTSEWDFLYNKAHNEYLNYAATTGFVGLGTYLLFIGSVIVWNIKKLKAKSVNHEKENFTLYALRLSLFSAWLSILVTNFFGFSVVIIQLFFFLIPAWLFILSKEESSSLKVHEERSFSILQKSACLIVSFIICFLLFSLAKIWYADVIFTTGYHAGRSQDMQIAYENLQQAIALNPREPFYRDEFSIVASQMAAILASNDQATLSARLEDDAILASDHAITTSPNNVNFWKSRTRVFYTLSQIHDTYVSDAIISLERAKSLSPTDPKIRYNLGLLYDQQGENEKAITELLEAGKLKADYRDAYYALSLLYEKNKTKEKSREMLNYILTKINPDDEEAKKKLEELK